MNAIRQVLLVALASLALVTGAHAAEPQAKPTPQRLTAKAIARLDDIALASTAMLNNFPAELDLSVLIVADEREPRFTVFVYGEETVEAKAAELLGNMQPAIQGVIVEVAKRHGVALTDPAVALEYLKSSEVPTVVAKLAAH